MNDTELLDRILFELETFESSGCNEKTENAGFQMKKSEEFYGRTNSIE